MWPEKQSSFFIPLEQGLKRFRHYHVALIQLFFLHSIRTRIKTHWRRQQVAAKTCSFFIPLEQGLKRLVAGAGHSSFLGSFFIPLEQGLKQRNGRSGPHGHQFFLHSIRTRIKTIMQKICHRALGSSFFIPLEQGLKHVNNYERNSIDCVLSSFHQNKD